MSDHQHMNGAVRPTAFARSLERERQLTFDAAHTAGVDATNLVALGEVRPGPRPDQPIDLANYGHQVLANLADARNRLCWWLEQVRRGADRHPELAGELTVAISQTLAATALAFHHADHTHALMADWRREVAR